MSVFNEKNSVCSVEVYGSYWAGTFFSQGVLPRRETHSSLSSSGPPPKVFMDFILEGLLPHQHRSSESCRDSWAFSVSAAVQCAAMLAYKRMGVRFLNRYMSAEYLLSCYEVGPTYLCGCLGDDLPEVLQAVSQQGIVTFDQFPYVTTRASNLKLYSNIDVVYFCEHEDHLGTCRPCKETLQDYVETVLSASPDEGAYRFTVPCLPCSQPIAPKYFPTDPFHVMVEGAEDKEAQASAIQKELVRIGPLCVALAVDIEAFTVLLSGGTPPVVGEPSAGLFYRPRHVDKKGPLHTALLVGYSAFDSNAPFWICRAHVGASDFGYSLQIGEKTVDSLFNVGMYDEVSQLSRHVVSFEEVSILTKPGGTPHSLQREDPLTEPLSKKVSLESRPTQYSDQISNSLPLPEPRVSRHFFRLLLLSVFAILVTLTFLVMFWNSSAV